MIINNTWSSLVKDHGTSPCNRVAWVIMKIGGLKFGVYLVYASNDYRDRINLWKWLTTLPNITWIFGGDFNMIENVEDKSRGLSMDWKCDEKLFWDIMKSTLHLFDPLDGRKGDNKNVPNKVEKGSILVLIGSMLISTPAPLCKIPHAIWLGSSPTPLPITTPFLHIFLLIRP